MQTDSGKVLFYNETSGEGIIVTRSKEKFPFNVSAWGDFDYLPKTGLYVSFTHEGDQAVDIAVQKNQNTDEEQDELPNDRPDGIKETVSTETVINTYFEAISTELGKYHQYSKAEYGIDFQRLRRFLLTTYNNLVEIDINIKKSEVATVKYDLIALSDIYDEFKLRAKHVKRAFHDLFLNRNDEFVFAEEKLEINKELIGQHEANIILAEAAVVKLERILSQTPPESENHPLILKKIKAGKAKAVDEIHHKRELEEENLELIGFIEMIINENEESFKDKFSVQAKLFDEKMTLLLNKLAYIFDLLLWKTARSSKPIKDYFRRSQIKGQLSSVTYLKYYLQSLNQEKLSAEHKELFEIVTYLQALRRQSILYFSSDIDNVMRLKPVIASIDKTIEAEMMMDYDRAIESIVKKIPNFIFIDSKADFKRLIKTLRDMKVIEETCIVLLVDTVNDKLLELSKRIYVEHVLQTRVSALVFAQEVTRILEGP